MSSVPLRMSNCAKPPKVSVPAPILVRVAAELLNVLELITLKLLVVVSTVTLPADPVMLKFMPPEATFMATLVPVTRNVPPCRL